MASDATHTFQCNRGLNLFSQLKKWPAISFFNQICDDVIYLYFGVEMCIKMIAMGVFGKGCYLSETWNRLDFFIVLAGWVNDLNLHDILASSMTSSVHISYSLSFVDWTSLIYDLSLQNAITVTKILSLCLFGCLEFLFHVSLKFSKKSGKKLGAVRWL